jgi:hypothetical protein
MLVDFWDYIFQIWLTVRARRPGRNNQDRIARKGLQGEDSQEKKPGHDMEKDSLERAARARGISYEGHIRTTRTG